MLIFQKTIIVCLSVCILYLNVSSQTQEIIEQRERALIRQKQEDDFNRRKRAMDVLMSGATTGRYVRPVPRTPKLSKEERAKIKAILAPNAADAAKYADFLRQKNTGLFRLFPDFDCQAKNVIRVDGDCANIVPGSWNYSFRQKDYAADADFLDVRLRDGNLVSDGFLSQGIIVRLGDVPLENVSPASGGIKFLLDFEPQIQSAEAKKQFAKIEKGIEADGYKYATSVKAEENTTYALRVIAYRNENKLINRLSPNPAREEFKFINLNYADKRIDLTVAFRVVRRDADGNLTILWKELNRRDAPKIVFAKNEKLSDIKRVE